MTGTAFHKPFINQFDNVYPYSFLSEELQAMEYCELISGENLAEEMLDNAAMYNIEDFGTLEPKLSQSLDRFYQVGLSGVEIRWLHF